MPNHYWDVISEAYINAPSQAFALVTLVEKQGSSYLQPGARLLVRQDGQFWGEISAGCLEDKVSAQALECIATGRSQLLTVDTRPLYGCFGEITLLIEVLQNRPHFDILMQQIRSACELRRTIEISTDYGDPNAEPLTQLSLQFEAGESGLHETLHPAVQLMILGDWPDGRAIANIGKQMRWQATVYDASAPSFAVEETLDQHRIDAQTAVILATHNLARDARCMAHVLCTDCGYIGVIGSRKRRQELARLIGAYDDFALIEKFEEVCCPAGLDLGGQGAAAIALSIVAEIQSQFAQRSALQLKHRPHAIHTEAVSG